MNFINYITPQCIQALPYEEWRPISELSVPNIEYGSYYISTMGRVYSFKSNNFLTPVQTNNGYYRVYIREKDGHGKYHLIHRIVMIEFSYIPNYKEMQVNHKDGIKEHFEQNNLEWTTCKENIQHAYDNGLKKQYHGEDCSYATITNAQAEQIAQLIIKGLSHKEISEITGVPKYIIDNISAGATWVDIYNKYELYKYKREPRTGFSDEELHMICKFYEDNPKENYKSIIELHKDMLMSLFGIEYTKNMSASLSRIYNKKTRKNICNQYNY